MRVLVRVADDEVRVEVAGRRRRLRHRGAAAAGFGLAGMRERVYLAGGQIDVESGADGTIVRARMPVRTATEAARSAANQMAS